MHGRERVALESGWVFVVSLYVIRAILELSTGYFRGIKGPES